MHEQTTENSPSFKIENNIPLHDELPSDIDLESKEEAYRLLSSQAEKYRSLPETATSLAGTFEWPIDPFKDDVVIACPFNSANYADSSFGNSHEAVDIQGPVGEKVHAPAKIRVVEFSVDPRSLDDEELPSEESLGDITFVVEEPQIEGSVLVGTIAHMRLADIPESLRSAGNFFNMESSIVVEQGEPVGSIGTFPFPLEGRQIIPPGIKEKFGNSYNHIHIAYRLFPRSAMENINHWAFHVNHVTEKVGGELVDPILLARIPK